MVERVKTFVESGLGQIIAWLIIVVLVLPQVWAFFEDRYDTAQRAEAREALPVTADFFYASQADLVRENGRLMVQSDGRVMAEFDGSYRVTLRDRNTFRHIWTPEWSPVITYAENAAGQSRYRASETLEWWAGPIEGCGDECLADAYALGLIMETCWRALHHDSVLGDVWLEPICVTSALPPLDVVPPKKAAEALETINDLSERVVGRTPEGFHRLDAKELADVLCKALDVSPCPDPYDLPSAGRFDP